MRCPFGPLSKDRPSNRRLSAVAAQHKSPEESIPPGPFTVVLPSILRADGKVFQRCSTLLHVHSGQWVPCKHSNENGQGVTLCCRTENLTPLSLSQEAHNRILARGTSMGKALTGSLSSERHER